MKKKLNKIAKDTNLFLSKFLFSQKKTELLKPMRYGLLPGGKKIRSKLIFDIGKIFNVEYKKLIQIQIVDTITNKEKIPPETILKPSDLRSIEKPPWKKISQLDRKKKQQMDRRKQSQIHQKKDGKSIERKD